MFFIRLRLPILIFFSGGVILILHFFSCRQNAGKNETQSQYASLDISTPYVGIEACKQCHSDKFDTYIHTGMGLSFEKASRKKSSANFIKSDLIHDKFKNLNYYPHWKNDSFLLTEFRIDKGDTIYKREEIISWIVGSGQHTNSHMINANGYIYQAPATFYTQKKQWDLPPGFENGYNTRFSRMIGLECMTCHNAYPKIILGSENKYEFVANGIDCERCHGPGGKHVKEKQAGDIVDVNKEIDYSIVNPSKLPIDLQLDVCQRCHIQGNAVLEEGKSFLDFRPGMHLSEVMNVYMPLFKGDDDSHIMASHAERMKMSKCFIESVKNAEVLNSDHTQLRPYKNSMTCVTCHDPHVSVRTTDPIVFNNKCISCHNVSEIKTAGNSTMIHSLCKADLKVRMKTGDNCVGCHMPKNNTIDIPHVTATDHWIRVPVKQKEINKIKEFAGLTCINNPDAGAKSMGEAFLSYYEKFSPNDAYLDSAKKYFNDDNKDSIAANFKNLIRWAFLKNDFGTVTKYANSYPQTFSSLKLISYSNDDAWTAYRIGESFYNENDLQNAVKFFGKSVELAPYQLDFRNKFAGAQQDAGQIEDARKNYEFIINENPNYTSAYINLGYLIMSVDNDSGKADKLYDKALELDPDNLQAYFNKAGVQIFLGQKNKARFYLKEILKRDKGNVKANLLLATLK